MSKLELDFSFRRDISQIKGAMQSTMSSLPKEFSSCGLSLNNTSRFEEKKALRKWREEDLLNRINQKLKKSKGAEDMLKDVWKFRPVSNRRNRLEKENQ